MKTIETTNFRMAQNRAGQIWLRAKSDHVTPRDRRMSASDAHYLRSCGKSFDAACVMEFGVGVFRR